MTVELSITSMALFLIVLVPALKMALGVFLLALGVVVLLRLLA